MMMEVSSVPGLHVRFKVGLNKGKKEEKKKNEVTLVSRVANVTDDDVRNDDCQSFCFLFQGSGVSLRVIENKKKDVRSTLSLFKTAHQKSSQGILVLQAGSVVFSAVVIDQLKVFQEFRLAVVLHVFNLQHENREWQQEVSLKHPQKESTFKVT